MSKAIDGTKTGIYLPKTMKEELAQESERQDRSVSWLLQRSWALARKEVMQAPTVVKPPLEDDQAA